MSYMKQHLHTLADEAGMPVSAYLDEMDQDRKDQRDYEEWCFWRDVSSGEYFKDSYEEEQHHG